MNESALLHNSLLIGAILVSLGVVGFLCRRNMIVMFLSAEMMLQGVSVSLIAWGRYHNNWDGQSLVVFILTVAACEAGLALAMVLMLFHRTGSLDIAIWHQLREADQPSYADSELPEDTDAAPRHWPKLTPAGHEPQHSEEEELHRSHV